MTKDATQTTVKGIFNLYGKLDAKIDTAILFAAMAAHPDLSEEERDKEIRRVLKYFLDQN